VTAATGLKAERVETDDGALKRYLVTIFAAIPLAFTGILKWLLTAQSPTLLHLDKSKLDDDAVPLFEHQLLQRKVLDSVKMYDAHAIRYNVALDSYPVLGELGLERMDETKARLAQAQALTAGRGAGAGQDGAEDAAGSNAKRNPYMIV
jgi:hypothetical protein